MAWTAKVVKDSGDSASRELGVEYFEDGQLVHTEELAVRRDLPEETIVERIAARGRQRQRELADAGIRRRKRGLDRFTSIAVDQDYPLEGGAGIGSHEALGVGQATKEDV